MPPEQCFKRRICRGRAGLPRQPGERTGFNCCTRFDERIDNRDIINSLVSVRCRPEGLPESCASVLVRFCDGRSLFQEQLDGCQVGTNNRPMQSGHSGIGLRAQIYAPL